MTVLARATRSSERQRLKAWDEDCVAAAVAEAREHGCVSADEIATAAGDLMADLGNMFREVLGCHFLTIADPTLTEEDRQRSLGYLNKAWGDILESATWYRAELRKVRPRKVRP